MKQIIDMQKLKKRSRATELNQKCKCFFSTDSDYKDEEYSQQTPPSLISQTAELLTLKNHFDDKIIADKSTMISITATIKIVIILK